MKICFVLPQMVKKPIGGYKIVYEYANRLTEEGHEVFLLYLNESALLRFKLPKKIRYLCIKLFTNIEPRWFKLNKKIKKLSSTDIGLNYFENQNVLAVATGVDTVKMTLKYFPNSTKAYFIQGYETWAYREDEVNETFSLGLDNIVVAGWLKNIVDRYAQSPAILLRNPIDTNVYRCKTSIIDRNPYTIGVLYHEAEQKGFRFAYEALLRLKSIYPKLEVKMFGTSKPTFEIYSWMDYTLNASQNKTVEIYNDISVFLCATVSEGYGLTGLEAMACGAVLVSTEYDGVKEYAIHGENALLSPICDVDALVDNAIKIIDDPSLRKRISLNGIKSAKGYSWECAMIELNKYVDRCENDGKEY